MGWKGKVYVYDSRIVNKCEENYCFLMFSCYYVNVRVFFSTIDALHV